MEAAVSASASPMKAINFLVTSTTPRPLTNPTTFPPWPPTKPNSISLYSHPRNTPSPHGLTRCSTAPNSSGTDFDTGKNPSFGTNSSPKTPNPPIPISSNEASSSSSVSSVGLVFDLGPTGSWDCAEIGSPVVKRFLSDEEERWYMWYYGRSDKNPSSDCIGVAVSSNGVHWERGTQGVRSNADVGLVMDCSNDWWAFDTEGIRPGEVMIMSSSMVRASSSVYWLYYTGYNSEKIDIESMDSSLEFKLENPEIGGEGKIFKSLPGLAMSQDGRHWARIEGDHHSGALFDVGSEGDWDSMFIAAPQVVFHSKGDLRMYYHSFDSKTAGQFAIGIARSRDGMKWVKLGKIALSGGERGCFDEHGVMNAHVIKKRKNGKYVMAYEGVGGGGVRSIGLAESSDGLRDWRKVQDEAILSPAEGEDGWDCKGVGSPCLVQMDGEVDEWRVYYRGVGIGGRTGIGMAVSQGSEFRRFRRWSGFHL